MAATYRIKIQHINEDGETVTMRWNGTYASGRERMNELQALNRTARMHLDGKLFRSHERTQL